MNWRELCSAALAAKDPDELLKILQELNKALKHEEQIRRDFRETARTNKPPMKSDVDNYRESNNTSVYLQHEGTDASDRPKGSLR
jgi:hypothetical protein